MQESMVKFLLVLIALMSLALGGAFLTIPGWFVTLSQAEPTNVAWLRMVGAGLVSVQGLGLSIAAFRRRDTNPLVAIIALVSTIEAAALWYSLVAGEFSAEALWAIIVPGILATAATFVLWAAWLSRRKSLPFLHGGGESDAGAAVDEQGGSGPQDV
ncbi:MAG: hypothetical protein ACOC1I_02495 [Spirochaetota bacterium]